MTAPDLRHEEWCLHWDEGKACDCLRAEAMALLAPRWEANLDLTDRQTKAVAKILRRLAARPNRRPETREACLAVAEALNPRGER